MFFTFPEAEPFLSEDPGELGAGDNDACVCPPEGDGGIVARPEGDDVCVCRPEGNDCGVCRPEGDDGIVARPCDPPRDNDDRFVGVGGTDRLTCDADGI